IQLPKSSGELARAEWHSTPNLKTKVWQILGIDASSGLAGIGCIFSTRTTLCCRGFTSAYAKEPSRAMLARSFAGTRWQIQKDIGLGYPSYTGNCPACLTTGTRTSPLSN